ncbi:REP-associated tyrosine transposase [Halomonas lysinitropha]|uniref:Transposase IS200 like protein n=1 Tax=Halomonas lysinitropha TaxID=2607506 RepID=A0A5K1I835_9GAMM|nr:transposase [Halomonas lysinitropha]VVZ96651.1 Transposase IS200 like protein [Halomonas lysinitropha]
MPQLHSHDLRKGRKSIPGYCYLLTIVTDDRQPHFRNPLKACLACRYLYCDAVQRHADTLSFVLMPDHLHWLIQLKGSSISTAVKLYKAKVARDIGEAVWQRGFHDHALRHEEDLKSVARYIVANPLRARLVDNIMDYPYWNAAWL